MDSKPGPAEQSEVIRWGLRGAREADESLVHPATLASIVSKRPTKLEVARLQAAAGYGKTRTVKRLIAELRARGQIAIPTASTNLAATNYERGMSTHALALLAGDGTDDNNNVTIKLAPAGRMTPERLALLRACDLIVIDEDSSLPCTIAEALLVFLEEHKCAVRVLFVGDREQIPPVVVDGSREETVELSVLSSSHELIANCQEFVLTKPYRLQCATWARFVRSVGDGTAEVLPGHALNRSIDGRQAVLMPLVHRVYHESDANMQTKAIEDLFGVTDQGCLNIGDGFRAILCTRNDLKDDWNNVVNARRASDTGTVGRTYIASHRSSIEHGGDDGDELAAEALGEDDMASFQNVDHSVPLSELTLRVGDVMLLTKTIDKVAGLVKNARVTAVELRWNAVVVRLDRSDGPSTTHTIGRARFSFGLKRNSPIKILRTQLPLVHSWALTINRSQGQTLDRVLLDCRRPSFSHGQANVAISRVHLAEDLGVIVNDSCCERLADGTRCAVLANVVYDELLTPIPMDCAPIEDSTLAPPKKIRLENLLGLLDDRQQARRMRLDRASGAPAPASPRLPAPAPKAAPKAAAPVAPPVAPPGTASRAAAFDAQATDASKRQRTLDTRASPHVHRAFVTPRHTLLHVDREEPVPNLTAKELEVRVEATLNELFARAHCDADVTYDELYAALILVEPRVAHIGRRAIEEALAQMELANKVMYREEIVHLI